MSVYKAVFWDFGGVITSSPFESFNRYEAARGLPQNFLRRVNATDPDTNAWARLEASRVDLDEFDRLFAEESQALGHRVPGREVLPLLAGELRPEMVAALERLKAQGYLQGCLTNNIKAGTGPGMARSPVRADEADEIARVMALFDFVQESSVVGIRKPDREFYRMACTTARLAPSQVVYLDDLGINLKPARVLGMHTIKVEDSAVALAELGRALGEDLRT